MTKTVDLFTTPLLFSLTLMATGLIACAEINDGEPPPRLPANPDTVPPRPSGESAIRFVVLADMNSAYGSTTYNRHVHKAIEMIREELQPYTLRHQVFRKQRHSRGCGDRVYPGRSGDPENRGINPLATKKSENVGDGEYIPAESAAPVQMSSPPAARRSWPLSPPPQR
jgi:hypothetical protein